MPTSYLSDIAAAFGATKRRIGPPVYRVADTRPQIPRTRDHGMVAERGEAPMRKVPFLCALAASLALGGSLAMAQSAGKDDPPDKSAPKPAAKSGVYSGSMATLAR